MKFGVREICDVVLRAKAKQKLGSKTFYRGEPVLKFDSLKTSTLEGAATTVYATGGRGNSRLIAWEGEKTMTFTFEDALLSTESFSILSGANLIENSIDKPAYIHKVAKCEVKSGDSIDFEDSHEPESVIIEVNDLIVVDYEKHAVSLAYDNWYYGIPFLDLEDARNNYSYHHKELYDCHYTDAEYYCMLQKDNLLVPIAQSWIWYNFSKKKTYIQFKDPMVKQGDVILVDYYIKKGGYDNSIPSYENLEFHGLKNDDDMGMFDTPSVAREDAGMKCLINLCIGPSMNALVYEHTIGLGTVATTLTYPNYNKNATLDFQLKICNNDLEILDILTFDPNYPITVECVYDNELSSWSSGIPCYKNHWFSLINNQPIVTDDIYDYFASTYGNEIEIYGYIASIIKTPASGSVKTIEITPDKFAGNYYLEAKTLFRREGDGVDMPAEFVIPNGKIQSNFNFTMASSGDPSTFTFTMDAFPDYTKFDHKKKVLAAIQIMEDNATTTNADYRAACAAPVVNEPEPEPIMEETEPDLEENEDV